jgi:DmsE family decaheme c-type cytochrome
MKSIRMFLAIGLLAAGMGGTMSSWAADGKLPNLGEESSKAVVAKAALKKDAVCTGCHDESETAPILTLYQTKHGVRGDARTPTCQSCHGESDKHVKGDPKVKGRAAPDVLFKKGAYAQSGDKERSDQCLTCHKGEKRTNWDGGQHQNSGLACNSCHQVHKPADKVLGKKTQADVCYTCHKEQRADGNKISHHPIAEGKVVCSDCHNPHGSTGPKLLKKNTVTETCYQCHAEKRGPFLWEHQPVTEDCANCHTPHGSNTSPLLKTRAPMLCDECHDGPHNSQAPYGAGLGGTQTTRVTQPSANANNASSSAAGRACMNCHVMVHGSNSPTGALLHR